MDINELFINREGRLRSGWRLALFAVAVLFSIRLLFALTILFLNVLGLSQEHLGESKWGWVVQATIFLGAAIGVGWVCGRVFEDMPWRALGWGWHQGWLLDWLKGSFLGALSLGMAALFVIIFGGFRFSLNRAATAQAIGQTLLVSGLIFILAAAAEEAMFRGYPLQTMARAHLAWVAIVLTSLIFSMGHLANPNVVAGFTFVNTALAGVWLAIAYLRTRSLWFPLGLHWAWNWTMGSLLGLPVSGIEQLTPNPLLHATLVGPAWLTGGAYGIEGGAACTLALIISTIFIWRTKLLSATDEMLGLTSHEIPKREPSTSLIFRQPEEFPTAPQTPLDR